jgi:hypothetical protein
MPRYRVYPIGWRETRLGSAFGQTFARPFPRPYQTGIYLVINGILSIQILGHFCQAIVLYLIKT